MRSLDSEALATFIAIVDYGSFTAAAGHLGKTQAAVSTTISRFEQRLGKRLFERSHKGNSLTETGTLLLGYARRIRAIEDEALEQLLDDRRSVRVRLGMPDDYVTAIGAFAVKHFAQQSRVQLEIVYDFSRSLERMMQALELDLALITRAPAEPRGELLASDHQVWCCAPNAEPEKSPVLDLAMFSDKCRVRDENIRALEATGRRWRIASTSSHFAGIRAAVEHANMLTVLPAAAVPSGWRQLGPRDGLPLLRDIELAALVPDVPSHGVRTVLSYLRSLLAGDIGPSGEKPAAP